MAPPQRDPVEAYKARLWEYAELHRKDPDAHPWKLARIRAHLGCSREEFRRHEDLRDLFWNVRRLLNI